MRRRPASADDQIIAFEDRALAGLRNPSFRRGQGGVGRAELTFELGENTVSLPLAGVRQEFAISEGSPDSRLLDLIAQGLAFVPVLRPGDPIPSEVLTGDPSWEVAERHRHLAARRVNGQLVAWLAGENTDSIDGRRLDQLARDPRMKEKINAAFAGIASELGFGQDEKERVIDLIQELVHELAYIEALRESAKGIQRVGEKIRDLQKLYGAEFGIKEIADAVNRLMRNAVGEMRDHFTQLDAVTTDIVGTLRHLRRRILEIRAARDELYKRLVVWQDPIAAWMEAPLVRSGDSIELLRETYRFLAPRYMDSAEWTLRNDYRRSRQGADQAGAAGDFLVA